MHVDEPCPIPFFSGPMWRCWNARVARDGEATRKLCSVIAVGVLEPRLGSRDGVMYS